MADTQAERIAAISALLVATDTGAAPAASRTLARTGNVVDAGGTVERLLIEPAILAYSDAGVMHYPQAGPGDVIRVTARQAARLDGLGVTIDADADLEEVNAELGDGELTDEQLAAMAAPDLVAYVAQHPELRARVRALEEARPAKKRRSTVLAATEPTPLLDADAAAGDTVEPPIEETDTTTPGTPEDDGAEATLTE